MQSIIHRRDKLVISTIEVLDEFGIQKLSTKEIAKKQDVSEATLFKHFKSKNDLLNSVLDHFSKFDSDIINSTKLKGLKPIDSILYLISSLFEYYDNYPAVTSILQLFDVFRYEQELSGKIKDIFDKRSAFIKQLVDEAQTAGDIRTDVDSECLADMLLGFCREACLRWRINGCQYPLKEKVLATVKITLDAYCQK